MPKNIITISLLALALQGCVSTPMTRAMQSPACKGVNVLSSEPSPQRSACYAQLEKEGAFEDMERRSKNAPRMYTVHSPDGSTDVLVYPNGEAYVHNY